MLDRSFQVALHIQFRFSCQLFLNHLLSKTCTLYKKKWCTYYILTSPASVCFWYRSSSRLHFLDYCMSHFCKLFFPFLHHIHQWQSTMFSCNRHKSAKITKKSQRTRKTRQNHNLLFSNATDNMFAHFYSAQNAPVFRWQEFFIAFIKKSTKKYWNDCHTKRFRAKSCPVIVWVHVQVLHFLISCMH